MKLGIAVGHSRRGDSGAETLFGETEHSYNSKVADKLMTALSRRGIESFIIDDYKYVTYSSGIRHCAKLLRDKGATHAMELHFNAASASANGAEWLHWHSSNGGKRLAESIRQAFNRKFPMMTDRGLKPKHPGARGAMFLRTTHCPAIITEPFFGSSQKDCAVFQGAEQELAEAYADGITQLNT
jgi:N-acetylmuramoyl-L-alanine amidase